MSQELDMSQYLDLFIQEAEEQLETLEQETLKLEQDPSKERLQVIFRAAHTLKGSSRAMGFQNMAELTHEMENILDQLRNDELSLTTEIANALLGCLDSLAEMVESIGAGNGDKAECAALVQTLQGFSTGSAAAPKPPAASTAIPSLDFTQEERLALMEASKQSPVYRGHFSLSKECVIKYARVFMVTTIIENAGELLACFPDREALEEEKFDSEFDFIFQLRGDLESFKKQVSEVSELEKVVIEPYSFAEQAPDGPISEAAPPAILQKEPVEPKPQTVPAQADAPRNAPPKTETGQTVRVDVSRLDALMNLVGELVIDRTRVAQVGAELSAKFSDPNIDVLAETVGHIARITSDLQDQIMKARMMPIETVFNRFPRVIRDLAQKLDKDIRLDMMGGDTELDRSVIEVIGDPLLHILRNSADHGLETPDEREKAGKPTQGVIALSAKHQENNIVIEIRDDGRGIDVDRIRAKAVERGLVSKDAADRLSDKEVLQFIFSSGFSTAQQVSEVSGRGVGMDIVRSNLQKLGGIIEMDTKLGQGTVFTLKLPLTLAIIRGLLVKEREVVYVLPLASVVETLLVQGSSIESVNQQEVIVIRGMTTPLYHLSRIFDKETAKTSNNREGEHYVVIVGVAEKRIGLVVEELIGEQEVVIKSLSRHCGDSPGITGATILGDGNVALIMDVNRLVTK